MTIATPAEMLTDRLAMPHGVLAVEAVLLRHMLDQMAVGLDQLDTEIDHVTDPANIETVWRAAGGLAATGMMRRYMLDNITTVNDAVTEALADRS